MGKECKFCHLYAVLKENEKRTSIDEFSEKFKTKYFATLVTRDWNKESKQYVGRIGYDTVPLKYCPLCGEKIKG